MTTKSRALGRWWWLGLGGVVLIAATSLALHLRSQLRAVDGLAARVDGTDFPLASLDVFVRLAREREPEASRREILDSLIEDQLFASAHDALRRDASGAAQSHEAAENPSSVGYSPETTFENELFRLVRRAWPTELQAALDAAGIQQAEDLLDWTLQLDPTQLEPLVRLEPGLTATMTAEQTRRAEKLVIARSRLADGVLEPLTLGDVYRRQNIQLKVQIHSMNWEFLREATKQVAATRFGLSWFRGRSGLKKEEVAAIERMVRARLQRAEVMHELGMLQDLHDHSPELAALAKQVTPAEIAEYYAAHRDDFVRVDKVRARHVQLASQEEADHVYRELKSGLDFGTAIQRHSRATDRDGATPGDLGWIERADRHTSWLRSVALIQPLQVASTPFRSPDLEATSPIWEIVYLDERITSYQPVDSESVRYEASKAVAREKIKRRYEETRRRLWRESQITYLVEVANDVG